MEISFWSRRSIPWCFSPSHLISSVQPHIGRNGNRRKKHIAHIPGCNCLTFAGRRHLWWLKHAAWTGTRLIERYGFDRLESDRSLFSWTRLCDGELSGINPYHESRFLCHVHHFTAKFSPPPKEIEYLTLIVTPPCSRYLKRGDTILKSTYFLLPEIFLFMFFIPWSHKRLTF